MLNGLQVALEIVARGGPLSAEAMQAAIGVVMAGEASPAQLGGLLMALRVRGETEDELLGAALAMREAAVPVPHGLDHVLDTCGTGGDGGQTFNISTTVAFVCTGAGVTVGKHGNRAVSSKAGSADVLEALGVPLTTTPAAASEALRGVGFAFLFAPAYHPATRHASGVRRELGVRTLFNLLGPLSNPARATHQMVGVPDVARIAQMARVLGRLGSRRALVVCGEDGLDEVSPAAPTKLAFWDGQTVVLDTTTPEALGFTRVSVAEIAGGDAAENARLLRAVLAGQPGPHRDAVLLNAAWALVAADRASSPADGLSLARESLDSGRALRVLEHARAAL